MFGEDRRFEIQSAILLYKERTMTGNETCMATMHEVTNRDGQPALAPGAPITVAAIESLTRSLGRHLEASILPECVLAVSLTKLAWWTPSARRRIWFNPADRPLKDDYKKLNGKFVWHPALLFVAGNRSLSIFALDSDRRPAAETKLCVAPYWNLSPEGHMCNGNAPVPDLASPSLIPKFEQAFFNSSFSHSHWGHRLTRCPGGHRALWQEMARPATKAFPARYLIGSKLTLAAALKGRGAIELP
jgi:PRTRC genetic system protein B